MIQISKREANTIRLGAMGLLLAQLHNHRGEAGNALRRMDKPDPQDMGLVLPHKMPKLI
jgi:hypothetical protein